LGNELIIGFLSGKIFAAIFESYIKYGSDFVVVLSDIFPQALFSLNIYHIACGLIGGAIMFVWRSEGIFE
jgi:hypothetical protein